MDIWPVAAFAAPAIADLMSEMGAEKLSTTLRAALGMHMNKKEVVQCFAYGQLILDICKIWIMDIWPVAASPVPTIADLMSEMGAEKLLTVLTVALGMQQNK